MGWLNYILKSVKFYKKQHLLLLLGTFISASVIIGGLIIGDSVKYSLLKLSSLRLGKTQYALNAQGRFVSYELASRLEQKLQTTVSGVLTIDGLAINPENNLKVNQVNVIGIDTSFTKLAPASYIMPGNQEVYLNQNLAKRLNANIGQELVIRIQPIDPIPVNAPFAQEKPASVSLRLTITDILSNEQLGRYSLQSDQKAPLNLFVPREVLEHKLELQGKANTLLIAEKNNLNQQEIKHALNSSFQLNDASLFIKETEEYFEINSERVFIDKSLSNALTTSSTEEVLTYLVNNISLKTQSTPYSFVSGLSSAEFKYPNGAFINQWTANDLQARPGDTLNLTYYVIGDMRQLSEENTTVIVEGILPDRGDIFQPSLMPDFPGLANAESCSQWETGVPIDLKKIRDQDEKYWEEFKGTPKVIIPLALAKTLWANPYGECTALRYSKQNHNKETLKAKLNALIAPQQVGLHFVAVADNGNHAATHGVDFAELFLSLSFFVLLAAVILLVLFISLSFYTRIPELNTLFALGIPFKTINKLWLSEGTVPIFIGSSMGAMGGIGFARFLLWGMNTLWYDAVRTNQIAINLTFRSIVIGIVAAILIGMGTYYILLRKFTIKQLINKAKTEIASKNKSIALISLPWITLMSAIAILAYSLLKTQGTQASLFLSAGALTLLSLILFVNQWLLKLSTKNPFPVLTTRYYISKSLSRQKRRSIAAISLLAISTFSVLITGANRKTFAGSTEANHSGTGGYVYWAESSIPVSVNLNTVQGKESFNFADEAIADSMSFLQLLTLDGNDASCLNLNQVAQPQILGLNPKVLNHRESFSFTNLLPGISNEHPWLELEKEYGHNIIPCYADQTIITWGLIMKLGDTLHYVNETGEELHLVLAGGLASSVFQGNVLIDSKHFRQHFPSVAGAKSMLIDFNGNQETAISELLDFYFQDIGLWYTFTNKRLDEFNSVTNTYLNIFMLLGGLALIIGTIGFGLLVIKNRQERKQELALLTALGISAKTQQGILLKEQLALLAIGIAIGGVGAFVGILPSILSPAFSLPIRFILFLFASIFLSGMLWIAIAALSTKEKEVIAGLRSE
jgi:ABC-type antimicrobial peptide transport system permease subunit